MQVQCITTKTVKSRTNARFGALFCLPAFLAQCLMSKCFNSGTQSDVCIYIYIYIYIYICTDYSVWCIWRLLRLVKNTTAVDILNCINCKMCSGHQRLWRMQNYPMYTHTHTHTHTHTLPCVGIIEEMQAGCAFIMLLFSAPKILSDLCPVKVTVSVCLSKQRVGLWLY